MSWTNEDFRILYATLRDYRAVLDSPEILQDKAIADLLQGECQEASRILSRIVDALEGGAA